MEQYAAKQKLKELINVAVQVQLGITRYMELAVKKWGIEAIKAEATCDSAVAFQNTYQAVLEVIRTTEEEDMAIFNERSQVAAEEAQTVDPPTVIDQIDDIGEKLERTYEQALSLKYQALVPLLDKLSSAAGVRATIPEVKGMWRVLEKLALRDGLPGTGIPWDIVRAQISGDTMQHLLTALDALLEDPSVQIVQVNDRFANPKGGWADCAVYFCFPNTSFPDIITEVQFCHSKMLLVRQNMGAHHSYSDARFFAELVRNVAMTKLQTMPWCRFESWKERAKERARRTTFASDEEGSTPERDLRMSQSLPNMCTLDDARDKKTSTIALLDDARDKKTSTIFGPT